MAHERDREPPIVLGGSLTRSPDGRLQTLQTHNVHISPKVAQQIWNQAVRRRYPTAWDRQPLGETGVVITWSDATQITCGKCRRSLGKYRGYQARDEYGIVEDTAHEYQPGAATTRSPGDRSPRRYPRFAINGEVGKRAGKTTAHFHCPQCRAEYDFNLARLGHEVMKHALRELVLN
jgi:hypothetical protein